MSTQKPSCIEQLAYKPSEAAKMLGISETKLTEMLRSGEIKGRRAGRRWIVPRRALEQFLNGEEPAMIPVLPLLPSQRRSHGS